mmetsp:Transcript_43846/g.99098  ORF Transcript_43846/g.99098 Transcript_43846/m.99098 type:complete len:242 (-) Transcript_43846:112-837(-)
MWHASVREAPLRAVGQNGPRGPTRASKARTSGPVPFPLQHALLIRITPLHLRRLPDRAEVAELEDGVQPSLVRSNHDERQRAARPPSELRLPDAEHAGRHGDQNSMGMTRRDERRDEGDGSEGLAKARIIAQHRPALLLRAEEEAHAEQLVQLERFENAGRQQREPSTSPQHAPASNKAAASRLQSQDRLLARQRRRPGGLGVAQHLVAVINLHLVRTHRAGRQERPEFSALGRAQPGGRS